MLASHYKDVIKYQVERGSKEWRNIELNVQAGINGARIKKIISI